MYFPFDAYTFYVTGHFPYEPEDAPSTMEFTPAQLVQFGGVAQCFQTYANFSSLFDRMSEAATSVLDAFERAVEAHQPGRDELHLPLSVATIREVAQAILAFDRSRTEVFEVFHTALHISALGAFDRDLRAGVEPLTTSTVAAALATVASASFVHRIEVAFQSEQVDLMDVHALISRAEEYLAEVDSVPVFIRVNGKERTEMTPPIAPSRLVVTPIDGDQLVDQLREFEAKKKEGDDDARSD